MGVFYRQTGFHFSPPWSVLHRPELRQQSLLFYISSMKNKSLIFAFAFLFLFSCGKSLEDKISGKWNVTDVTLKDPDKFPKQAEQIRKAKITGAHKYTFYDFMPDGRYDLSIAGDTLGGRWVLEEDGKVLFLRNKFGELRWELQKVDEEEIIMMQRKDGGMIYTMKKVNSWKE